MDKAVRVRRLQSILSQFPCPRRALDLGCGDDDELAEYILTQGQHPQPLSDNRLIVSVDRILSGLHNIQGRKTAQPLQADLTALPFGRQTAFDLILVRHPDIDRSREQWLSAFAGLPTLLCEDGILLITTYSAAEIEQIRRWLAGPALIASPLRVDRLTPPDLVGRDRFVMAFKPIPSR